MCFSFKPLLTFSGGIHPPEEKEITRNLAIEKLPFPNLAVIPLSQHAGKPAIPQVQPGDNVKTGDLLGEADGFISARVHSPFTGKILKIEPAETIFGFKVLSVFLEIQTPEEISEKITPPSTLENLTPSEIVEIIKNAGIVGLGGAAFPTHVKISPPPEKKIRFFVVNGAECEPYLNSDNRLMVEESESIVEGAQAVQKVLGVKDVIFAIEDNKPQAIKKMQEATKKLPGYRVVVLKTKYPQGGEKQLIKSIFNWEVPSGCFPIDVGVVVLNVGTLFAVFNAIKKGLPLIERVVTIAGDAIKRPGNYLVRIGTLIKDLVEFCGGFKEEVSKVIAGGPMMGVALGNLDVPVVKGTSGLLFFSKKFVLKRQETNCLKCGRCYDACPLGLLPFLISELVENKKFEKAKDFFILDCMECGACAYVCPAGRPLVQYIKTGKMQVLRKK